MEIRHRYAHAQGIARPLSYRFFSAKRFPLELRRYILRSLAVSRFLYGSVALNLRIGVCRRFWYRSYLALWRTLQRRDYETKKHVHPYRVLQEAAAPSPPLALAYARATFLQRLALAGPALPLRLLQHEWELCPREAWLQQLHGDVKLVATMVPAARQLLDSPCLIRSIFETFVEQPHWWSRCVQQACKVFQKDLEQWAKGGEPSLPQTVSDAKAHVCVYCGSGFTLRRYLATHMARHHGILSPARHFVPEAHCVACLRYYHSVQRVHSHLRHSARCMRRALQVIRPLTPEEIHAAEAPERQRLQQLSRGNWQLFTAAPAVQQCYGPALPTFEERFPEGCEDLVLTDFTRFYRPSVELLTWFDQYEAATTTVGVQVTSQDFWQRRPGSCADRTDAGDVDVGDDSLHDFWEAA